LNIFDVDIITRMSTIRRP